MSKVKSSDKDFLHDNNKADGKKKKIFVVYRTPEFWMQSQVFLFQLPHSKGQSVSQTRSSLRHSMGEGRVCTYSKVVRNTAMDFVIFSFESYHLVSAGISEDLKGNRLYSSHHTGVSFLGEVLYRAWKFWDLLPKAPRGCGEISHCSPGTAAKHWGFVCFSSQQPSTWVLAAWQLQRDSKQDIYLETSLSQGKN